MRSYGGTGAEQMKPIILAWCIATVMAFAFAACAVVDAGRLLLNRNETYCCAWFDNNWFTRPIINGLAKAYGKDYYTVNADHSERWFAREVTFGKMTYWTIL